jgi:hypothetical protein
MFDNEHALAQARKILEYVGAVGSCALAALSGDVLLTFVSGGHPLEGLSLKVAEKVRATKEAGLGLPRPESISVDGRYTYFIPVGAAHFVFVVVTDATPAETVTSRLTRAAALFERMLRSPGTSIPPPASMH